jgi:membrane-bound serine protease (ClpP class)
MKRNVGTLGKSSGHRSKFLTFAFSIAMLCACAILLPRATADEHSAGATVVKLRIDGEVEPILANYIDEGLADAARRHASLVLINMDTPGGLTDSMKDIIEHMLASSVPVAVYISPSGSRGASAGFYILIAADVAAMAPGTHTGAASPILRVGGFVPPIDEVLRKKINNDAMAFLRSFSEKRGRNPTLAETAVTDAKAFTETEALNGKMIDLIAGSEDELLHKLNGRTITRFDGTSVTLALENPVKFEFQLTGRQKFLSLIVQPDVFFILLIVGVMGLYTEFTHPGVIAPGVFGGIALVLALYAMKFLPINLAGILLIGLALAFFILEAKFTSHGVLALGGILSMFLGAIFLVRSPITSGGVSIFVALAVTLPFAVLTVFLMRLVLRSRRWKSTTGREELVGAQGTVVNALGAGVEGMIRVHGELWQAASALPAEVGASVRVVRVEGLKLRVEPERISVTTNS